MKWLLFMFSFSIIDAREFYRTYLLYGELNKSNIADKYSKWEGAQSNGKICINGLLAQFRK